MANETEPTTIAAAATAVGTVIATCWIALKRRSKGPDMLMQRVRRLEDDAAALKATTASLTESARLFTAQIASMEEDRRDTKETVRRIFEKLEEVGHNANTALTILAERRRE
jgi:phage shock protein A